MQANGCFYDFISKFTLLTTNLNKKSIPASCAYLYIPLIMYGLDADNKDEI